MFMHVNCYLIVLYINNIFSGIICSYYIVFIYRYAYIIIE